MDKNPTTISREVRKYSSLITTGYPGSLSMPVKADLIAGRKRSVEKSVLVLQKLGCDPVAAGDIMLKPALL